MLLLAGPDRVANAMARSGVGDGTTVVVYDDTQNLFASRVWWSLRAYGFDSARLLDGGYPAWAAESRTVSNARPRAPATTFTPRAQLATRLTTADIRRLLGSPDVADPRRPRSGRVPRPRGQCQATRAHSRCRERAGRRDSQPGSQRLRDADELRSILHKANVTRGPTARLLRRLGRGRGQARVHPEPARPRRRGGLRRRLGGVGQPARSAGGALDARYARRGVSDSM